MTSKLGLSADLSVTWIIVAAALTLICTLVLLAESLRGERRWLSALSGVAASAVLLLAVCRPVRIQSSDTALAARTVVLVDVSRSTALPGDDGELRTKARDRALEEIRAHYKDARLNVLAFGDGPPRPYADGMAPIDRRSDLLAALRAVTESLDERPDQTIVLSDGRLDDPPESADSIALEALGKGLGGPVHTVALGRSVPKDASIRKVQVAAAAIAHVPLPVHVELGCEGLACESARIVVNELRENQEPRALASAQVPLAQGRGQVDVTVTLDRAGARTLEVRMEPQEGDQVPDNDRRYVSVSVKRERVRILHVAGRPASDVRALRQWLKGDAAIDLVTFFILRTPSDNPQAPPEDLALIPFPVDELFSEHLSSFDAVVLQDFDSRPYGLRKHLPALARYVRAGGGLIMVGGPNAFVAGGYAGTDLGDVLPVALENGQDPDDDAAFTPNWTQDGATAPLLAALHAVTGGELPPMPGTNLVGDLRPQSLALWEHPSKKTRSGARMPVLAVGEHGDGRSIALTVDGSWLLSFSSLGARTAGRGHAAMWDGLLGWLMRDPRYEPAQLDLPGGCVANLPSTLRIQAQGRAETAKLNLRRAGVASPPPPVAMEARLGGGSTTLTLPPLPAGGYTGTLQVGSGLSTRVDFACEVGGDEWADSRPDAKRLERIATATGGTFQVARKGLKLPSPRSTVVSVDRKMSPIAPAWLWCLLAAGLLGAHWILRRQRGLV